MSSGTASISSSWTHHETDLTDRLWFVRHEQLKLLDQWIQLCEVLCSRPLPLATAGVHIACPRLICVHFSMALPAFSTYPGDLSSLCPLYGCIYSRPWFFSYSDALWTVKYRNRNQNAHKFKPWSNFAVKQLTAESTAFCRVSSCFNTLSHKFVNQHSEDGRCWLHCIQTHIDLGVTLVHQFDSTWPEFDFKSTWNWLLEPKPTWLDLVINQSTFDLKSTWWSSK